MDEDVRRALDTCTAPVEVPGALLRTKYLFGALHDVLLASNTPRAQYRTSAISMVVTYPFHKPSRARITWEGFEQEWRTHISADTEVVIVPVSQAEELPFVPGWLWRQNYHACALVLFPQHRAMAFVDPSGSTLSRLGMQHMAAHFQTNGGAFAPIADFRALNLSDAPVTIQRHLETNSDGVRGLCVLTLFAILWCMLKTASASPLAVGACLSDALNCSTAGATERLRRIASHFVTAADAAS